MNTSNKSLIDFLKFKSIALVGNATSLLNHEFGQEIDNHDIVIRMNRVVNDLNKYAPEKCIGRKTEIVFAARPIENIEQVDPKFVIWTTSTAELFSRWCEMFNSAVIIDQTSREAWKQIMYRWPTTGWVAFNWLLQNQDIIQWDKVDMYGFDFFESNSFVTGQNNSKKWHLPDMEKHYILTMIEISNRENERKFELKGYYENK